MTLRLLPLLLVVLVAAACEGGTTTTYTLYRNSVLDANRRLYVATFAAPGESEEYNVENCNVAAKLFNGQPGIATRFWCEKGDFKK